MVVRRAAQENGARSILIGRKNCNFYTCVALIQIYNGDVRGSHIPNLKKIPILR